MSITIAILRRPSPIIASKPFTRYRKTQTFICIRETLSTSWYCKCWWVRSDGRRRRDCLRAVIVLLATAIANGKLPDPVASTDQAPQNGRASHRQYNAEARVTFPRRVDMLWARPPEVRLIAVTNNYRIVRHTQSAQPPGVAMFSGQQIKCVRPRELDKSVAEICTSRALKCSR